MNFWNFSLQQTADRVIRHCTSRLKSIMFLKHLHCPISLTGQNYQCEDGWAVEDPDPTEVIDDDTWQLAEFCADYVLPGKASCKNRANWEFFYLREERWRWIQRPRQAWWKTQTCPSPLLAPTCKRNIVLLCLKYKRFFLVLMITVAIIPVGEGVEWWEGWRLKEALNKPQPVTANFHGDWNF